MRHALGVLGVLAAGVLLAVSAAMNWRFGFYLGTTEIDGIIYGSASAAADGLKALIPFFIVAAWRNKMWSQMAASAVVWLVVTAYSLTSALGHAALNRQDTASQRAAETATYASLTADLERAKQQLSWVPQHRPAATVQSELSGMKAQRQYKWTRGCTSVKGRYQRRFCNTFTGLKAELGSAEQAAKLEARIADTQAALASTNGAGNKAADPQAQILTKLTALVLPGVRVEDVQTGLAVFIALLLEVGSGLGMYIAFSQWRIGDRREPIGAGVVVAETFERPQAATVATNLEAPVVAPAANNDTPVQTPDVAVANDNASDEAVTAPVRVMAEAAKDADVVRSDVVEVATIETTEEDVTAHETTEQNDDDDDRSDIEKFVADHTEYAPGSNLNVSLARIRYNNAARKSGWKVLEQDEFNREVKGTGFPLKTKKKGDPNLQLLNRRLKMQSGAKKQKAFESKAA